MTAEESTGLAFAWHSCRAEHFTRRAVAFLHCASTHFYNIILLSSHSPPSTNLSGIIKNGSTICLLTQRPCSRSRCQRGFQKPNTSPAARIHLRIPARQCLHLQVRISIRLNNHLLIICFRDQMRENVLVKQYYCDVDIAHLISYNEELAHKLTTQPADIIPLVCLSTRMIATHLLMVFSSKQLSKNARAVSCFPHKRPAISPSPNTNFSSTPPSPKSLSVISMRPTYLT